MSENDFDLDDILAHLERIRGDVEAQLLEKQRREMRGLFSVRHGVRRVEQPFDNVFVLP